MCGTPYLPLCVKEFHFSALRHGDGVDYAIRVKSYNPLLWMVSRFFSYIILHVPTYKFKRGFATPIIFIFDLRRNVPYFYDTCRVEKITLVAELNVIPDAPWW